MVLKRLFLFTIILSCSCALIAQENQGAIITEDQIQASDTIQGTVSDSSLMKIHSPKKAAVFSAIIPGAGQVYNKKYWKVPLIYAAGIGMAYLISFNYGEYQLYRESYITRVDTTSTGTDHFPTISSAGLKTESERYQKNYELAVVGLVLVYILQIVDASVDAHFKTFDVSDDLSMSVRPTVIGDPYQMARGVAPTVGFKLNLRFK